MSRRESQKPLPFPLQPSDHDSRLLSKVEEPDASSSEENGEDSTEEKKDDTKDKIVAEQASEQIDSKQEFEGGKQEGNL